jgi:ABC-type polysaccharide/polyol phosphate export permease
MQSGPVHAGAERCAFAIGGPSASAEGGSVRAHGAVEARRSDAAAADAAWVEAPPRWTLRVLDECRLLSTRLGGALPLAARLAWREWRQRASPWLLCAPVLLVFAHAAVLALVFGAGDLLASPAGAAQRLAAGALLFSILQHGLARGATALVDERALLSRRAFPLEALILRPVLSQGASACLGLALLAAWGAFAGTLGPGALLLVPVVCGFALLVSALALLLAVLHARHRAAAEALAWALPLATLATPVWWDPAWVGAGDWLRDAMSANPLAAYLGLARGSLGLAPFEAGALACAAAWTIGAACAALLVLAWRRPHLCDEV